MRLHALVEDEASARRAVDAGATVVQLRRKGASTAEVVAAARPLLDLGVPLVVNDDVDAALEVGAGVHLGQGDPGVDRAAAAALPLIGVSVTSRREAAVAEYAGATYLGAGAVWATPSKPDAKVIGLGGLADLCQGATIPVVAIGGIDASNAADCIRAGASGVAVIRALDDLAAVRAALDAAL